MESLWRRPKRFFHAWSQARQQRRQPGQFRISDTRLDYYSVQFFDIILIGGIFKSLTVVVKGEIESKIALNLLT